MDMSNFGQVFVCLARIAQQAENILGVADRVYLKLDAVMSRKNNASMATEPAPLKLRFFGKLLIAAASLAVTSLGQTSAAPSASSQPPASTSAVAHPAFEVAAIKLNQSGSGSSHSDTNNGRFTATNVSLKNLMEYQAYGIPGNRILDGPKWLDSTKFDIEAKMDDSAADHLRTLAHGPRRL
jgi:hypothetical protein